MSEPTRSAAILSGGRATRFGGRDKSALLVDGRTILDRQLAELSTLTTDLLIVGGIDVARGFKPRDRGPERAAPPCFHPRVIQDIVPDCGPLGGLHAALTAAHGDVVAIVACDMPHVSAPLLAYLFSLAADVDVVVPRTERGYHPLCAVYARRCLAGVTARLATQQLKMTDLVADAVARAAARIVTIEELERFGHTRSLLANVNTPAEYAELEALQGHEL
jgi:molybdopterin-guanine dinucleotide biosynthesis protein A